MLNRDKVISFNYFFSRIVNIFTPLGLIWREFLRETLLPGEREFRRIIIEQQQSPAAGCPR